MDNAEHKAICWLFLFHLVNIIYSITFLIIFFLGYY